ncbi:MAG: transcription elongation factor GreA [Candidatus Latescibacter sp.]|nr:transcription elongation factor GreA [Candidatus Latescibacter sp.]
MCNVHISREAERKLHEELKFLKEVRRPEVLHSLQEARRKGDLSENGEYDAAKEEQRLIQSRINHLEVMIRNVCIIEDQKISSEKVYIGARVDMKDLNSGEDIFYILVHEVEADFKNRKISTTSPIGKTLLGKAVGEVVEITVPKGTLRYRIVNISR